MIQVPLLERLDEAPGAPAGGMVSLKRLAESVRPGRNHHNLARVREVITSADMAWLADLTDRGIMAGYADQDVPITYDVLGYRRDTEALMRGDGTGNGRDYRVDYARLLSRVREKGEYPPITPSGEYFNMKTYKYGAQLDISWESWLEDGRDLRLMQSAVNAWGLSARYTNEYLFTSAYAGNTTFFSLAHANYAAAGSALAQNTLAAGIAAIRKQNSPAGNIMPYAGPLYLVVPPELDLTAKVLVQSPTVVTGNTVTIPSGNPVQNAARIVVNPFLPTLDVTHGTTAWYLFCESRLRPAVRYGFLRGYEEPQVWVRAAQFRALASGAEDPFDGDARDDIEFKLRTTFGADLLDYRGAYMATGQS